MNEINRIKKYINKYAPGKAKNYNIRAHELVALAIGMPCIDAVLYAFIYGKAKGYRAAKAEMRDEQAH